MPFCERICDFGCESSVMEWSSSCLRQAQDAMMGCELLAKMMHVPLWEVGKMLGHSLPYLVCREARGQW